MSADHFDALRQPCQHGAHAAGTQHVGQQFPQRLAPQPWFRSCRTNAGRSPGRNVPVLSASYSLISVDRDRMMSDTVAESADIDTPQWSSVFEGDVESRASRL